MAGTELSREKKAHRSKRKNHIIRPVEMKIGNHSCIASLPLLIADMKRQTHKKSRFGYISVKKTEIINFTCARLECKTKVDIITSPTKNHLSNI
jgi:hypothetical protein